MIRPTSASRLADGTLLRQIRTIRLDRRAAAALREVDRQRRDRFTTPARKKRNSDIHSEGHTASQAETGDKNARQAGHTAQQRHGARGRKKILKSG